MKDLTPDLRDTPDLPDMDVLFRPFAGRRGLVLAVSGGMDSTALMVLAARWRDGAGRNVPMCVATVDHGLRPEASAETALVRANAERLGLDCVVLEAHMNADETGGNIQARARDARYRCLMQAARECRFDTILTAHHRGDQAETFLIRLARGSGVYGLGSMSPWTDLDGLVLARPLLDLEQAQLQRVTAESGLASVEDPSNRDPAFARIRWRCVMPELEKAGLGADRIAQTAGRLRRAADALDHYAGQLLKTNLTVDEFGAASGDARFLADAPDETALRALARLLQAVGGSQYTPRLDRIEQLLSALRRELAGSGGLRRTLNDCLIDLNAGRLRVCREWGRSGPPTCEARAGRRMRWDGRFGVHLPADLPAGLAVAPLGLNGDLHAGAGNVDAVRTLPGIFAGESLYALPRMAGRTGEADFPLFACENLVEDRLFGAQANRAGGSLGEL